ncbi:lipid II:glycine glycyltransferase [Jeotgalicoccus coquinae]|uniref:Lipid II:glycine glycyltransferase n=1 Tax=Jeotgalicoccus coquinae TaxID=709509 RepID=A0A6V7R3X7_9STAP|nr:lipid II:glycine glycyltransferase FemX [Jeotgalicoccus coquinae]MBB6423416.1 peptidoglycan pentaglycine glycine transferase (the first glycine) [Jeotgalicoccus coquinae]GGE19707.1 lipid II:glycine glycyltransferase [Jeotgalicoccus coquinae]CAD2071764.1 Lipid II:glycine glycyltransferase [Jeotgalicoccus coquinae]
MVELLNITDKMHDEFVMSHPSGDLLQLSSWAGSKELTGWYWRRIAVGRDGKVEGTAMLLFKKVPKTFFTMCYASRGFVCDYEDREVVEALLNETKKIAADEKSYTIKIDPDIPAEGNEKTIEYLKSLGFRHHGLTDGMSKDVIQPRTTMVTDVSVDDKALLQSFERNNRTKVRNSLRAGTTVYKAGREELPDFVKLMKETGERDGFLTRDITYFESLYDNLNPEGHMELFMVKLIPEEAAASLESDIEKINEDIRKAEKIKDEKKKQNQFDNLNNRMVKVRAQLENMNEIKRTHPDGVLLSGALYAQSGHKSYYLYGASSNDFREFLPNHHMQWHMMQYAREHGAESYDFGGVSVDPDKEHEHFGLWQFKKVWGTEVSDKIGEFDYVTNRPLYTMAEVMFPLFQKSKMKLNKIIKR